MVPIEHSGSFFYCACIIRHQCEHTDLIKFPTPPASTSRECAAASPSFFFFYVQRRSFSLLFIWRLPYIFSKPACFFPNHGRERVNIKLCELKTLHQKVDLNLISQNKNYVVKAFKVSISWCWQIRSSFSVECTEYTLLYFSWEN